MTLKEVMSISGLSKKSVYYYIEERLIEPGKYENGYFNFTENDVKTLQHIRKLRHLGLSVSAISAVIQNPKSLMYYLFLLQKEVRETLALEEWKSACIAAILNELEYKQGRASLDETLDLLLIDKPDPAKRRIIDSSDAEFLVYYFWGNFVRDMSITPYQQFLLEQLKQTIISEQDNSMLILRDYLYDMHRNNSVESFYQHIIYDEVSSLYPDQCVEYADRMTQAIKEKVNSHTKMREWIRLYHVHVYPSVCFFDNPKHRLLMREISDSFVKYQDNINLCCELVLSYLDSDFGCSLKQNIINKTQGCIDFTHSHSGEIAYLYVF